MLPIPPNPLVSKLLRREQRRQRWNSRDTSANYGYGPQSSLSQGRFNGTPSNGFSGAMYSTPSLTTNTNTGGNTGLPSQLSPNPGVTFAQQTQIPISANANSPYLGFGYNMLSMGLSGMERWGVPIQQPDG